MIDMGDPVTNYADPCGCVWADGKRVSVCAKHRHKDGIEPDMPSFH